MEDNKEYHRILDAAQTLTPGKFVSWADGEGYKVEIENSEDVFNLNRDYAIVNVDGFRLIFDSGKLKM
jgi:hypothetical protein